MADFYNILGSSNVLGTAGVDRFFLFNRDANPNNLRADATLANFVWNTSLHRSDGSIFQLLGSQVNISSDVIFGDRTDAIYGSNYNDAIVYNNGGFADGLGGFRDIQLMYLNGGDDFVDLTAHGPGGVAYGKDMKIYAGDGNDTIVGGAGADVFYGEAGNDLILGFAGADTIYGGDGDDTLYGEDLGFDGSSSYDTLYGQRGNDTLYGGGRADTLDGGDDNDTLYGGADNDSLIGGAGNDILYGDDVTNTGADKLSGGGGDDQLYGRAGNDELHGDGGNDLVDGGAGKDFLGGDGGADILLAGGGDDTIDGGTEIDYLVFSGNRADYRFTTNPDGSLTLIDQRPGSDGTDIVRNIEFLQFADGVFASDQLDTPPEIISNGGGAQAAITVNENDPVAVTTVIATDIDVGQTLRYAIAGGDDAALFTIDAVTGVLLFASPPDFEDPYDRDGNNIYDVIVAANDGVGGVAQQRLAITVSDVADGQAPTIVSNGAQATAAITVDENGVFATTVAATDPAGLPLSFRIAGGADAAKFTIDAVTGVLSFIVAPDFEMPTDQGGNHVYEVVVATSNGTNGDHQALSITIGNTNDNLPVLTSFGGAQSASLTRAENSMTVATIAAADADGTAPTYSILSGADAALFTIDSLTGVLSFIASPDFEHPVDAGADNVYSVTVGASDGITTLSQALTIAISNVNDLAPVILSNGGGATGTASLLENGSFVTTVVANDGDGTTPTYAITGGADASFFTLDSATGVLSFVNPPDFEFRRDAGADGIYDVIVTATDGTFVTSQSLAVQVLDVNEIGRTLTGNGAANTFSPSAPAATQTTALNDTIFGLGGNDIIDGGAGADRMEGGVGNDTYYVDTWTADGFAGNDDIVVEAAGAGTDLVISTANYQLTAEVENLTLAGIAAISGWGNALSNIITGNAAANLLDGGAGNDRLLGGDGADTLIGGDGTDILNGEVGNDSLLGGAGSDVLDGGIGADRMEGGTENDTYTVDTWTDDGNATNDDLVIEAVGGGTGDLVNSSVSYRLTDEVERLTLTGTDSINGYGNGLNNILTGNASANLLVGDLGNDTIDGGAGNDTLQGGEGNDSLLGNIGDDNLNGGNGVDALDGGVGNDVLDGGVSNDTLLGQAGADLLIGGKGKDVLTGGADADVFAFSIGDTAATNGFVDTITDFDFSADTIDIDVFSGPLSASAYGELVVGTNSFDDALLAARGAMTSSISAIFVAGTTDGWLFWDSNGDHVPDQAVILQGANNLGSFDQHHIV